MEEEKALALRDEGGAITVEAMASLPQYAKDRLAQLIVRADEFRYYGGLAESMARGMMLPKGMNAQGAAICMLEGQSLGFTELQSLKHLTCINNMVGMLNVGAIAILRTNNALKKGTTVEKSWFWEPELDGEEPLEEGRFSRVLTTQSSPDQKALKVSDEVFNSMGCRVTMHKKGHTRVFTDSFTIGDAKRLGKWGDVKSAWAGNPMRMLFNRAWGRILTDHFSEFTSGLRLESELRDDVVVVDIDPDDDIGGVGVQVTVEDDGDPLGDLVAGAPESASEEPEAEDGAAVENEEIAQEEQESEEPDPIEGLVSAEEILGDQSREGKGDHRDTEGQPFVVEEGLVSEESLDIRPGGVPPLPPHSLGEDEEPLCPKMIGGGCIRKEGHKGKCLVPDHVAEGEPDPEPDVPTAVVACPHCSEPGDYEIGTISTCFNAECLEDLILDDEGNLIEST